MKVQPATEENSDALKILQIIWKHATETMRFDQIVKMLIETSPSWLNKPPKPGALFVAAERGNTRFIAELLRTYHHQLMISTNDDGLTIFHVAVMHRQQGVYNLLYEIAGSTKDFICEMQDNSDGNTMLHLVGKTSKQMATKTYGASLLMQRELLWFQVCLTICPKTP
ncbi:putative ankyrin repeat-containing domain superfamily [Helianthus annuus]|nr:putative ankyrin repeat-containing domain superfamily [Helianthus annuus]KAJ0552963.1 putative ankyrin repeat-containing domain superfamily [Helianthus annuus]KAJ0718645.1 putative ankyrin repeat-containing domain superfamily [Helianthus annuus]KAJ0897191.1 putative ankyrin repeat-containing domain superfamily [Helianthus annuus]